MADESTTHASAGHKLGQLVGDWFEEYFVLPLLKDVASRLDLFLDCRFKKRAARGDKIVWTDVDGNAVDFDFVLEIGGSAKELGVPIAFIESFWRRGSRHSKDKARDDSGNLLPMRETHPTARFLGIVAGGDFTSPARELIRNRGIDLFFVPKAKIITAFADCGLIMDYFDTTTEDAKARIADQFKSMLTSRKMAAVSRKLRSQIGRPSIAGYVDRVRAALAALPQEIYLFSCQTSAPVVFESIDKASRFLDRPQFDFASSSESFAYEITYTDGTSFRRDVSTLDELRKLHHRIELLVAHVSRFRL